MSRAGIPYLSSSYTGGDPVASQRASASVPKSDEASRLRPRKRVGKSLPRRSRPDVYVVASRLFNRLEIPTVSTWEAENEVGGLGKSEQEQGANGVGRWEWVRRGCGDRGNSPLLPAWLCPYYSTHT